MTEEKQETGSFLGHLWASVASTVILCLICCGAYPLLIWGIGQSVFPNQANGSLVKKDGTYTTKDEEAVGSALIGQNLSQPQYFHPRPSAAGNGYDPTSSGGSNLGPLSDKLLNGATQTPTTAPSTQPAVAQVTTAPSTQPTEALAYDGVRLRTIHFAMDNGLTFKLHRAVYVVHDDGTVDLKPTDEVPLSQFQDKQGNLVDTALVDAFPHPFNGADAPAFNRTVVIADDFRRANGSPVVIPGDAVTASGSGLDPHISPANADLQVDRVARTRGVSSDQIRALVVSRTDGPGFGFLGEPGVNVLMLNLALDAKFPMPGAK